MASNDFGTTTFTSGQGLLYRSVYYHLFIDVGSAYNNTGIKIDSKFWSVVSCLLPFQINVIYVCS